MIETAVQLQFKASILARLNPSDWAEFMKAFAAYAEQHRNNVINSPLPELPVNQGRAQLATQLTLLLGNCVEAEEARKAKKP